MKFSRRGFLGTIGASIGGLVLWPSKAAETKALIAPSIKESIGYAPLTFQDATREVLRGLIDNLDRRPKLIQASMLGETDNGIPLTRMLSMEATDCRDSANYYGVGKKLADRVNHERWTIFGILPVPPGPAQVWRLTSKKDAVSVRGTRQYYASHDQHRVRFDIIGSN